VVAVPVRDEDQIERAELLRRLRRRRVAGDPWIEQDPLPAGRLQEKRGVAEPGDGKRQGDLRISGSEDLRICDLLAPAMGRV
jgi:hypothetical protein